MSENSEHIDCSFQPSTTTAPSHKEDIIRKKWFTFLGSHDTGYVNPDVGVERTQVDERYREHLNQQLQPQAPNNPLPSTEFLNLCIRMYFTRFNPIFPIIHVPTFRPSKKDSLLLLSICSIGSLLLGSDRAALHGQKIFDSLSKAALAIWDTYISHEKAEALVVTQAALIGHTFAMLSVRPRDLLIMQSFHGTVVAWARRCGIFQQKQAGDQVPDMIEQDLEGAWKSWAQLEQQNRVAAALYIYDSEYAALLNTEPLMRHTASKLPSICCKDLWAARTAREWEMILMNASRNANAMQNPPLSNPINRSEPLSVGQEQDHFGTYCELEVIAGSICEAKELGTWPNISSQLETSLLQFYDKHLKSQTSSTGDPFCLETLWHSSFISLFADLNRLEICSGRDGYEESQRHLHYARIWAHSQDGQRCALHGSLILRKSGNMPIGVEPAIHLPRALYSAAMVWYCYTEFGQGHAAEVPAQKDEFAEFKKLGISSQQLLFEAHGFKASRPLKLESSTLYELVDLLRRIGHWGISRKLASLMVFLVHEDPEEETHGAPGQVY